jgi:hypothetical protein
MTRAKVERALDDLERMAPEIRDSRRWARNAAYDRRVRSSTEVRSSGKSDPTGSIATGEAQQELRDALHELDMAILASKHSILTAHNKVERALGRTDPRHEIGRDTFPMLPETERRKLHQAKARRERRGEGYGVS